MSLRESPTSHAPTVVIENLYPSLGDSSYLIKRIVGEPLNVCADIFTDGHVILCAVLKWRMVGSREWIESPMQPLDNDRWTGQCAFSKCGRWEYVIEAWVDNWLTWRKHFKAKFDAQDSEITIEAREGARLLEQISLRSHNAGATSTARELQELARMLRQLPAENLMDVLMGDDLQSILNRFPDRSLSTVSKPTFTNVERERARFSAWYEFFPRSADGNASRHSGFRDCLPRLDDAKAMGFDVIYFPPIHPIGVSYRKGRNNTLTPCSGDVGSPWAIGSAHGGHRSIEPALGTLKDFEWLVGEAKKRSLDVALDFAVNCSPDHPYVKDHPDWFHQREDGSIRYAENPPKKYQDIYPINFHCADWKALWRELIDVVLFWVRHGIKIFRVDNPHTKPVSFWEVLIAEVQAYDPEVLFLAEAFTKPRMMQGLGKIGFSQSYTYFTWRESKQELTEYALELTKTDMRWYYRANFWPNTPDILPHHLQHAGPAMFKIRAALAATLSSNWGIYSGYELCENQPLPAREEYLDSEKFEIKTRNWNAPGNIKGFIRVLNESRRANAALQYYDNLHFHTSHHKNIIIYSKVTPDFTNRIIIIINLDPSEVASDMVHLDMSALGLADNAQYHVHDLVHGVRYKWQGATNYVSLDPNATFMHLFRIES